MSGFSFEKKMHYILRTGCGMCFIGHGTWGVLTKSLWCNYFAVFGIGHDLAYHLMPLLGSVDILMGIALLVYPMRALVIWLVIWGFVTALLRPLSGEPFAEFIERAGNFGAPLALLLLSGGIKKNMKNIFMPVDMEMHIDAKALSNLITCLKIAAFTLLAGHGWLNLIEKKALLNEYTSLGFTNAAFAAKTIGTFEVLAAFSILIRPVRPLILGLFIWKITSELFYPKYELFEWIERGGSYGCLLALWFALDALSSLKEKKRNYQSAFN